MNFSARHPVSVLVVWFTVCLFGLLAYFRLTTELLPRLAIPAARAVAEYPGIPAGEMEDLVTVPLENALSSVQGVKRIEAITRDGLAAVTLRFDWKADLRTAVVDIREKIDAVYPFLPRGLRRPSVFTEDLADEPIMVLAVLPAAGRGLADIGGLVRRDLSARLRGIEGIASVRLAGVPEKEILVAADARRLAAADLPLPAFADALSAALLEHPAGKITEAGVEYLIKTSTGVDSLEKIRAVPLPGGALAVRDFAEVSSSEKEPTSFFRVDGRAAAGVFIHKTGSAGTQNAAAAVRAALPALGRLYRGELDIAVVRDASLAISASFANLLSSILIGTIVSTGVLFAVFRDLRSSLIAAAAVPACMGAVLLCMYLGRMSLNLVSLSGVALGIGMVVDNGVVMLEHLIRRRARAAAAIGAAAAEMTPAVFASTVTTVMVFIPVVFVPGVTGALFTELAFTITFLLTASLAAAMTLTPALYALLCGRPGAIPALPEPPLLIAKGYRLWLRTAFLKPWLAPLMLAGLTACGLLLLGGLPKRLFPEADPGAIEISLELPWGTPIRSAEAAAAELSRNILKVEGVLAVYAEAGYERDSLRARAAPGRLPHAVRMTALYELSRTSYRAVEAALALIFAAEPAGRPATRPPDDPLTKLLGGSGGLKLVFSGPERAALKAKAEAAAGQALGRGLASAWRGDTVMERPQYRYALDRQAVAFGGIDARSAVASLRLSIQGEVLGRLKTAEEEIDVRARLRNDQIADRAGLERIPVAAKGASLEAGLLGSFQRELAYPELHRRGRRPLVSAVFQAAPGRADELAAFLAASSDGLLEGRSALEESSREFALVFGLAVVLMYLLLGAQFESLIIPLLLLASLPLSATGSFLLLRLMGRSLNLNSFLGLLLLLGSTINASIMLTDAYGRGGTGRVIAASIGRLTPVFATTATTVIALAPVAFNPFPEGALQADMAIAIFGGLAGGTILILLAHPPLYRLASLPRKRRTEPRS